MNNLLLLLKVFFLSLFGINKAIHSKNKKDKIKVVGIALLALFIVVSLGFTTFMYSVLMAMSLQPANAMPVLLAIMMTAACLITFFTTVYQTNGILFAFKDYDMLMALPVKTSVIVTSRILMLYLTNVGFTLLMMIPAGIVYAMNVVISSSFVSIFVVLLFIIPLIPIILGTLVGSAITMFSARFRKNNYIAIFLNLVLLLGIMALSMNVNTVLENFASIGVVLMATINKIYPFSGLYVDAVCGNFGKGILFILISATLFLLFACVLQKYYKAINSTLMAKKAGAGFKMKSLQVQSPLKALYFKELKRYFASSIYVVNTGFGMILMLAAAVFLMISGRQQLAQIIEIPQLEDLFGSIAPLGLSLFVAMTCTTACSVSLEGKSLWVIKSLPVSVRDIFRSKIYVNLTVIFPILFISASIFCGVLHTNLWQSILTFVTPMVYGLFIAAFGIFVNLHFPNFTWTSEVVAVKQSIASMVAVFTGMGVAIVPIIVGFQLGLDYILMVTMVSTAVIALLTGLCYRYISTRGAKIFNGF